MKCSHADPRFSTVKRLLALLMMGSAGSLAGGEPLRVLCWNIHHGAGADGRIDLGRIAKVIREARPDVAVLQEVDQRCSRSGGTEQCAELARLAGMSGHFGRAMDFDGGQYGQAILSRHPVKTSRVHALPGSGEPRIAFEVVVSWQDADIRVVSTHLDLDAGQRLKQARALVRLLKENRQPLVLCGDFNDIPSSRTVATMAAAFGNVSKAAPAFTHPAEKPVTEIDFVFTQGFKPVAPLVVLPEPGASDHRPMLVELTPG